MDVPGFAKPCHQYGEGFGAAVRELDNTEAEELAIWEKDGFTGRTAESST